jgi:hypothetical protein
VFLRLQRSGHQLERAFGIPGFRAGDIAGQGIGAAFFCFKKLKQKILKINGICIFAR